MIGERLKEERDRLDMTQPAFADACGAKKRTLIDWEKGVSSPTAVQLSALSEIGVDVLYVLTGVHAREAAALKLDEETLAHHTAAFVMVPRYDVQASAGGGALIHSELIVDHLAFRQEWVSKLGLVSQKLALIEVHGDSMEPALQNSDLVLIDLRSSDLAVDGIYVIQHRGHLLVKRVQCKFDGTVVIKSDNPAYETEVLKPEEADRLVIVGRVVWFGRQM